MRRAFLVIRAFTVFVLPTVIFSGCSPNNVTIDDGLGRYFDSAGVKGAFGLFDNGHGHFTIYNLSRYRDSFYTPGGTFDILQTLLAIQTGAVKDENSSISDALDSMQSILNIPGPHTLKECFRDTSDRGSFAFTQLGFEVLKRDTVKKWIDSLQYGNMRLGDTAHPIFWDNNVLKINCDQQLGLLKKLYFNQLPFFARTQEIVRRIMPTESNSEYRFCYKTAQEKKENGNSIGWVMGWVEENKHPYFFVVNLESADPAQDLRQTGLVIVKDILRQQGFFEGKK